jgi:hypothetical protein
MSNTPAPKKKIIWLLQSNQITPVIRDFLQTLQTRVENHIDLLFYVPHTSADIIEKIQSLNPVTFQTSTRTATGSYQAYLAKRDILDKKEFTDGLLFADALLLDDLGGGRAMQTTFDLTLPKGTCALVLQVPSPLGSSENEERMFHAAILWARDNKIPALGYELLPLDTSWTLAPSLPDGIITRHPETCEHLKTRLDHKNIWLIPPYEAAIFSSVATSFHINGVKSCYHHRNNHTITADKTILFLPHNVAMVYEYQQLIKILQPLGKKLHLMFSIGKDQIRGAYTHKEIIEIVYQNELQQFASYSFHDMNYPWEMMLADCVVACAAGFNTQVAEKEIPCIIYDPRMPDMTRGNKKRVASKQGLMDAVKEKIHQHRLYSELADIFMVVANAGKKHV